MKSARFDGIVRVKGKEIPRKSGNRRAASRAIALDAIYSVADPAP
jgi:hypothetical protein